MNKYDPIQGPRQTNNRAEMTACIRVLERVPMSAPLQLCADSQMVTDGATQWIAQWKRSGWRTRGGKEVCNRDLWERMQELMDRRQATTEWIKVPSHTGIPGNEEADRLAEKGVKCHGVPPKAAEAGKVGVKKKRGARRKNGGQESKERGRRAAPKGRMVSGNRARHTAAEH